jgi:uncharacterized protein with beta-barrel porin domain
MNLMARIFINLSIGIIFVLLSQVGIAATGTVTTNADTAGTSQTGSLRQVINYINASGDAGSAASTNTITINASIGTITLGSDLPVIQKGTTITTASGTQTIAGNNFRLFATYASSLSLNSLALNGGKAVGGSGGAGGLGAGGAVYIDVGQTLALVNTTITNCNATGGLGVGGGTQAGGGASFTIGSKNSSGTTGGGDNPGGIATISNNFGRTTTGGYISGGSGGGSTESGGGITGGGAAGGSGAGTNLAVGGYCGGGGGNAVVNVSFLGGGGGNPGAAPVPPGISGPNGSGGGGGYGSGGGGSSGAGSGGGGGFGGGGGDGSAFLGLGGGGGGGGFGGGGGGAGFDGGGGGSGGSGGRYGGNSTSNAGSGPGAGGGAGIGGAIFVADTGIFAISNTISNGTTITSNTVTKGLGFIPILDGSTAGPDVFLFRLAQVQFTGSANLTADFAINCDTTATGDGLDAGVVVNTATNTDVITLTSTTNDYQGGTTITKGILSIDANNKLPSTGAVVIAGNGTLRLLGTYTPTVAVTNAGAIDIPTGGSFTVPTSFSNTAGAIYLSDTGNLAGTITSGLSLNIGKTSTGTVTTTTFTPSSPITVGSTNIYNGSALTAGSVAVTSNLYMNGTSTFTGSSVSGAALTIGQDSFGTTDATTAFTASQDISTFPTINIVAGTFATGANVITANTTFNVFSGAFATLTAAVNGTGTFINAGQTTLSGGGSINTTGTFSNIAAFITSVPFAPANGSNIGTIVVNSGGSFTQPAIFTNTGTTILNGTGNIIGAFTGSIGSILTVGNTSASNYSTSGDITGVTTLNTIFSGTSFTINNTVTGGSNANFNIGVGTTVTLQVGANVNNFAATVVNGTYVIANGATYTLEASNNLSGSGTISNSGQLYVNNANVAFSGSFSNEASGSFYINGTPTITFSGTTFSNRGNLFANFNNDNSLPLINATNVTIPSNLDLSHGIIIIGYNNNYIASGNYTLLNAGTPPVPGVSILPQNTFYISSWSLSTIGNSLAVTVVRDGFDQHALTPEAVAIGAFLEQIGSNSPNASQLGLLNALEDIQNDAELTAALLSLLPPQYIMLTTLNSLDQIYGALDIRLVSKRRGYKSGDDITNDRLGVWIRPFSSNGTQTQDGALNGYTDKNHGFIFGIDRTITPWLTLGTAFTYTKTTVNDTTQAATSTNINTYQILCYSTLKSANDSYIDALIAGGVSNYHGLRTISFPGFTQGASSNYTSQQLTVKVRASKLFALADFWQFTPNAMAQYSFVRPLGYTETGAGSYNISTDPDNINLFRLGVGAALGIPFKSNNMISIPSVYVMAYVDAKGGEDTTNSQFISGGPVITNTVSSGRLMLKLGASYELAVSDNLEFVVNYDYVVRHGFKGTEGLLNVRYKF